jgi:hypothetical protein
MATANNAVANEANAIVEGANTMVNVTNTMVKISPRWMFNFPNNLIGVMCHGLLGIDRGL